MTCQTCPHLHNYSEPRECERLREKRNEALTIFASFCTTPLSAFGNASALQFLKTGDDSSEEYVSSTFRRMFGGDPTIDALREENEKLREALESLKAIAYTDSVGVVSAITGQPTKDANEARCWDFQFHIRQALAELEGK